MNAPTPPQLAEIDPRFEAAHYQDGRDLFPVTQPVSPATDAALAFAAGIAAACVLGEVQS